MNHKIAILIVNGGDTPKHNRWLELCLEKLRPSLAITPFQLYLWNNNLNDPALKSRLLDLPWVNYLEAASYEQLAHPHAVPLQRLYTSAREDGAEIIITLDSDAHPIRADWLAELTSALENGAALAGVWRAEMVPAIRPHIHPSCLCTTVDFIERYQLRFDFDNTHSQEQTDTLAHFTWVAEANGLPIHRLPRTNQRQFHYWMGGIYGDLIYHHGAASREKVVFHNSDKGVIQSDLHRQRRDGAADLLFNAYDAYQAWLQGQVVDPAFDQKVQGLMMQTETGHTLTWWLQRLRSGYLQAEMGQKIRRRLRIATEKRPLIYRGINKLRKLIDRRKPRNGSESPRPINSNLKSFQPENLAPVPAYGWCVTSPDFVGVGAPKSGTTWWYSLIMAHPQIVPHRVSLVHPANKETHYFVHFQYHGLSPEAMALYRSAFATPPGAICGEFSVHYLMYPNCLEYLTATTPNSKIIVVLRNPIDRFVSHLNHLLVNRGARLFKNLSPPQRITFNTYSLYTEAMLFSFYADGLVRLFDYFNRNRVLVLQYERLAQSPENELARTYRFLGVDERFRVNEYRQHVNQGVYCIPKPNPTERSRLAAYFKNDVQQTAALCPEIDLTLWPDFGGQSE